MIESYFAANPNSGPMMVLAMVCLALVVFGLCELARLNREEQRELQEEGCELERQRDAFWANYAMQPAGGGHSPDYLRRMVDRRAGH